MYSSAKDGITISSMLDTRKKNKDNVFPIKIRVTYNRERQYYLTGKRVTRETWEKLPKNKNREAMEIKMSVENSFSLVKDCVYYLASLGQFSFEALNKRLSKGNGVSINSAFRAKIESLKSDDMIGNSMIYNTTLNGIERFSNGKDVSFEQITTDWLKKYEKFLLSEGKSYNTIGIHMRNIRTIVNAAKKDGIVKEAFYPFGGDGYEIKSGEGRKLALTIDQIGKIYNFDNGFRATRQYRDYWMFLYFCNGINMADFVKLKYSNILNGEIFFVRQKTERMTKSRKEIRAVITAEIQAIIEKWGNPPSPNNYIFPILDGSENAVQLKKKTQFATRVINKHMAIIAKELGIEKISTYTARHSFATVLKRSGANIAYISESLGHNDVETTENYLASFELEERKKNAALLSQFRSPQSTNTQPTQAAQ